MSQKKSHTHKDSTSIEISLFQHFNQTKHSSLSCMNVNPELTEGVIILSWMWLCGRGGGGRGDEFY